MCVLAHAVGPDQGLVQPEPCKYGDSEQAAVYQLRLELTELQAQAAEWRSGQQERTAQNKSIRHIAEKTKILQIQMEEMRQERAGESIIVHAEKGGADPPPQVAAPAQMAPMAPPFPKKSWKISWRGPFAKMRGSVIANSIGRCRPPQPKPNWTFGTPPLLPPLSLKTPR